MDDDRGERWRWVPGYEGFYMVSDMGNVMGLPKPTHFGHIMKQKTRHGYRQVCLCKNNRKRDISVHRLVALAFVPNPKNKPEVNHLDGHRAHNVASNLEWVTRSENERHAYRCLGKKPNAPWRGKPRRFARHFTDEQVQAIRADQRSYPAIGFEYGVSKTTIRDIKRRKNYKEVM